MRQIEVAAGVDVGYILGVWDEPSSSVFLRELQPLDY
jgi:hypothetical protein